VKLAGPTGVALGPTGAFALLADSSNYVLRYVVISSGMVTPFVGRHGVSGYADGTGTSVLFGYPYGVSIDATGLTAVTVSTFPKVEQFAHATCGPIPTACLCLQSFTLVQTDAQNNILRIIDLASGIITTLAGRASVTGFANGIATAATFNYPNGVSLTGIGTAIVVRCRVVVASLSDGGDVWFTPTGRPL